LTELLQIVRRRRDLYASILDLGAWTLAFTLTGATLYVLGNHHRDTLTHGAVAGAAAGVLFVALGRFTGLHQGRARMGSIDDAALASAVWGATMVVALLVNLARLVPVQVLVLGAWPTLVGLLSWRGAYRLLRDSGRSGVRSGEPVVIIGAGEAARQLIEAMFAENAPQWYPVAMVDDDPLKRHRRLRGVAVQGRTQDLAKVAHANRAKKAIIAIASASADQVRTLTALGRDAGLTMKVLPSPNDLMVPAHVGISDVRDLDVTDLLGRHQIETDLESIADYLIGRRVLVTGAGGSIGAELCRQLATFGPSELIMLDRDESALHAVELSIYGKALLDGDNTVLADIRDAESIRRIFEQRRPQVVFHAAALKHLPMLEKSPDEALKTNVWGTLTVLEEAARVGVERFVNISTDKAANPSSVLGFSKRLAEGATSAVAEQSMGTFLSVRFGNVLGSRGSVLTSFAAQVASGGPVTVTDPRVTRYFMTIKEAVQLVIQAAAVGSDGEVLVLDMGEPVSIDAVARQVIELSGKRVEVVYTGLREGEKLHEVLFGVGEVDERPAHPLISHTGVPRIDPDILRGLDPTIEREALVEQLDELCRAMSVAARDAATMDGVTR
jgi:FlaA1/EpsC-like NDP-sugar epimerase